MVKIRLTDIELFVKTWNCKYPIDKWYRSKYNIPFNSIIHQESNFIDQYIEYIEDCMYCDLYKETESVEKYKPGHGNWFRKKKHTEKEIEDLFNKIDLDNL